MRETLLPQVKKGFEDLGNREKFPAVVLLEPIILENYSTIISFNLSICQMISSG
jgi:hypothetical protein